MMAVPVHPGGAIMVVTADDFGLTRNITDSILEAVDHGALTNVSILANGNALPYALEEYKKRSGRLTITAHLNLTEGKALSTPTAIPLLVDSDGNFRHSSGRLLLLSVLAFPWTRRRLREQVWLELAAQYEAISQPLVREGLSVDGIDGHQHVHMVPLVFGTVLQLVTHKRLRIPDEPLYATGLQSLPAVAMRLPAWCVLTLLAKWNRARARRSGARVNEHLLGVLFSGQVTLDAVRCGLTRVRQRSKGRRGTIELIFHPGVAGNDELGSWTQGRANIAWHYSEWRRSELALLKSQALRNQLAAHDMIAEVLVAKPR